jgi:hypothetical protein
MGHKPTAKFSRSENFGRLRLVEEALLDQPGALFG